MMTNTQAKTLRNIIKLNSELCETYRQINKYNVIEKLGKEITKLKKSMGVKAFTKFFIEGEKMFS